MSATAESRASARPVRILVAGDQFVLSDLLVEALQAELGDAFELAGDPLDLPWPVEPFGPIAEVHEACGSEADVIARLPGVEVVVTEMAPLTKRVIHAADSLRLIVVCRGGPVNVNIDAASARGVPVCFTPGRNAAATAEYTIGLMLAALRHIAHGHKDLTAGTWRGDFYAYAGAGSELDGKIAGLIGFGAVGSRVTRILRAFGATVLVYDPYVDSNIVERAGGQLTSLEELLSRSFLVSLHARLTPETRHLIARDELERMPSGAVLVNTARGGLLDDDALCDALETGHLRAAALDVYDPEPPPPDSRLFTTPRLILSPHIAGATRETAERAAVIAAQEVGRHARGEPLAHVANRVFLGGSGE